MERRHITCSLMVGFDARPASGAHLIYSDVTCQSVSRFNATVGRERSRAHQTVEFKILDVVDIRASCLQGSAACWRRADRYILLGSIQLGPISACGINEVQ
jgi:hypothetical protein